MPDSVPAEATSGSRPKFKQVQVRITIASTEPDEVMAIIYQFYQYGFAAVPQWSPLQPVPNMPNEVMSVMTLRRARPVAIADL